MQWAMISSVIRPESENEASISQFFFSAPAAIPASSSMETGR